MLPSPPLWQVEDAKRLLVLYGNKASQVLKDVLCDLHKLKSVGEQGLLRGTPTPLLGDGLCMRACMHRPCPAAHGLVPCIIVRARRPRSMCSGQHATSSPCTRRRLADGGRQVHAPQRGLPAV